MEGAGSVEGASSSVDAVGEKPAVQEESKNPEDHVLVVIRKALAIVSRDTRISVVLPVYNCAPWLESCLESIYNQDFTGSLEISVYDDGSTDTSWDILQHWQSKLESRGRTVILNGHRHPQPKGVGYSRNVAVFQSRGKYLCFQDADDVMMEGRVRLQLDAAIKYPDSIIGCQITRDPEGSTKRYTHWLNNMSQAQLFTQVFTSHGPTVLMATWFCSRALFGRVGKFDERGKGVPEDLLFFYNHLRQGGGVHRVDTPLLCYRYHEDGASRSVQENTIWDLRVHFLEERVLQHWKHFTIWNAGKQGRHLFRSLTPKNQLKVLAFCDVDSKKIVKAFYTYHESKQRPKPTVPVVHFTEARPPFVLCVKMDFTGGYFEQNLASLCLDEEVHYVHFN